MSQNNNISFPFSLQEFGFHKSTKEVAYKTDCVYHLSETVLFFESPKYMFILVLLNPDLSLYENMCLLLKGCRSVYFHKML